MDGMTGFKKARLFFTQTAYLTSPGQATLTRSKLCGCYIRLEEVSLALRVDHILINLLIDPHGALCNILWQITRIHPHFVVSIGLLHRKVSYKLVA